MEAIGHVHTGAKQVPRHWSISDVEGTLVIDPRYEEGLRDIRPGERIIVLFHFHKSPPFTQAHLLQTPPHRSTERGVFSICSPVRPNPIGLSEVTVLSVRGNIVNVRGLDIFDGTPILDIKPHITVNREG
jgi:tRNA-Thr(GGU) m(6)t(6)A37 methyltransferase TsaA